MTDQQRAYYAIIPANVRYDKALPANAKLLYGEITALCNERGYCWASNQYFAELYGTSTKSVTRWISSLVESGYIKSTLQYKPGTKEIANRYLSLVGEDKNVPTYGQKCPDPMDKNVHTPMDKNVPENNTVPNTTPNNTYEYKEKRKRFTPPSVEDVRAYCTERKNGIDPQAFVDYYTARDWYIGKNKMKDWKAAVRTWENRRKDGYSNQSPKPVKSAPVPEWLKSSEDETERMKKMLASMGKGADP